MISYGNHGGTLWLCGLQPEDARRFGLFFDGLSQTRELTAESLPKLNPNNDLILAGCRGMLRITESIQTPGKLCRKDREDLESCAKLLLLDGRYTAEELEMVLSSGFSKALRNDCTKEEFLRAVEQVQEHAFIFEEAVRLSREVSLEREILEYKGMALNFLMDFIKGSSTTLTPSGIISTAVKSFATLMPVLGAHAALWQPNSGSTDVSLFYSSAPNSSQRNALRKALLEDVRRECGDNLNFVDAQQIFINESNMLQRNFVPENGHVLHMPLSIGGSHMGELLLLTDAERSMSRDCGLAINAALRHMALTLSHALNYQTVKHHADYDALTGVYSRRRFEARIHEEVERAVRKKRDISVIFLDIDHFKAINDSMGHAAGDEALQQLAALLNSSLRTYDFVARYGGEEFVMVLPETTLAEAAHIAERLREKIAGHAFTLKSKRSMFTVSFGVSSYHPDDALASSNAEQPDPAKRLVQEADHALYEAKRKQRNCVCTFGGQGEACAIKPIQQAG